MAAETRYPSAAPAEEAVLTRRRSRVSWGAILAGFFCAVAIQAVLTLFGLFWGLGAISPTEGAKSLSGLVVIGGGVYWTITSMVSLFIGAWIAARLTGIPSAAAAISHGVTVWALTTLVLFFMLLSVFSMGAQTTAATARAASVAAVSGEAAPDVIDQVSVAQLPVIQDIQRAARERIQTQQDIRQELRQMYNVSMRAEGRAGAAPGETEETVKRGPAEFPSDVSTGLDRLFSSPEGELSQDNREQLVSAIAQHFNIPETRADRVVTRWQTRWQESTKRVDDQLQKAEKQITEAADTGTSMASKASVALAIAVLLNLLAAMIGAGVGRIGLGPARYPSY